MRTKYLIAKTDHGSNITSVIGEHPTLRSALLYIEEVIDTACHLYQGSVPPTKVRTTYTRNSLRNIEEWSDNKSYGFYVQIFDDPTKFACWYRDRTVGWLRNYWEDRKLFTLQVISQTFFDPSIDEEIIFRSSMPVVDLRYIGELNDLCLEKSKLERSINQSSNLV